jgi:capsular exopolysaccharide synthesis family protein
MRQLTLARLQAAGTNTVPLGKDGKPLEVKLKVTQAPKSSVFVVQASSSNPAYTQAYLDSLMNEYLEYKRNVRKLVSGDTLASISEQVLRLERDLKANQDALTTFERTNNLAVLEQEGTIAGSYLARLKTQLSDYQLESQLLEATALEQDLAGSGKTNSMGSLLESLGGTQSGSSSPAATERQSAFKELELLKIQREKLSKYLRPKHPKIVKLDADIERGQKLLEMYRNQNRQQLATARQALKMRTDSVLASIKEWEAKVGDANSRIAEADRLKLNVNRTQSLYDRLVSLLQNVDISRNIDQATLAVLEPASPAERSYKLELILLALAILGGPGAGLGIIALMMLRDDRFTCPVEVMEQFGDQVVGQVPNVGNRKGESALALLENEDERHMYAEAYRNLRSAILFLAVAGERPKILLITSAVPDEGKSTIAANLARTLALGGARVVLVDGDIRKGRLHELMGLRVEPGLTEALRQPAELGNILQTNALINLSFLSRGSRLMNPGDLFLGAAFEEVLHRLRRQFDYVLIDSSPVFAADDATTLAPKVDGTLFVVRGNFSSARQVREALELLHQRQAKILGLVFNRADASARSYYYYKYADYHGAAGKS